MQSGGTAERKEQAAPVGRRDPDLDLQWRGWDAEG
jgi:hypothetical protein